MTDAELAAELRWLAAGDCRIQAGTLRYAAARLDALAERVAELEAALKPFADVWSGNHDGTPRIMWDDLHRAAELLAGKGGERNG